MTHIHLSDIASIHVGYQTRGRIQEKSDGIYRLIQGRDFDEQHHLHMETTACITPERKPEPYIVEQQDILFQARGINNFAYCLENDFVNTLASGSFYIIRLRRKDLIPQFLMWWLNQPKAQNYFKGQASGTWMSFISKKTLARMNMPVPPIQIQEKIVEINNLWKVERDLCARLSELKGKLIESVCSQAVQE